MIKFSEYINDFKHENQRTKSIKKLMILVNKQQMELFQDQRAILLGNFQQFIISLIDNPLSCQNLAALNILQSIVSNPPFYIQLDYLEQQIIRLCFIKHTSYQTAQLIHVLSENDKNSKIFSLVWAQVEQKILQKQYKQQASIVLSVISKNNQEKSKQYIKLVYESEEISAFAELLKSNLGFEYLIQVIPKAHSLDIFKLFLEKLNIDEPPTSFISNYQKIIQILLEKPKQPSIFALMSQVNKQVYSQYLGKIMNYLLLNHYLAEIAIIMKNIDQPQISIYFKQIWNEIFAQNFSSDGIKCIQIFSSSFRDLIVQNSQIISQKLFCETLTENTIKAIQSLDIPEINYKLLQIIALELTGIPIFDINYDFMGKSSSNVLLYLQSLIKFDFENINLTDFCTDYISKYLTNDSSKIRNTAAQAMIKHIKNQNSQIVNLSITQILITAVTDIQKIVRSDLSKKLSEVKKFDDYLALQENIEILFISVSDLDFNVRQNIFEVIGRISYLNPTFVLPKVRELFLSQVFELNQAQLDIQQRFQSLQLMLTLVNSCYQQLMPYFISAIDSVFNIFEQNVDSDIKLALQIVQKMFICKEIYIHLPKAINIICHCLCSKNNSVVTIALISLQNIIYNTGASIVPYTINDNLFNKLNQLILYNDELKEIAAKTLVTIGVVNKYMHFKIPSHLSFKSPIYENLNELISHGKAVYDDITDTIIDKNEIVKLSVQGVSQNIKDNDLLTLIFTLLVKILQENQSSDNQIQAVILMRKILRKPDISFNLLQEAINQITNLLLLPKDKDFKSIIIKELIIIIHFLENDLKNIGRQIFHFIIDQLLNEEDLFIHLFLLMDEIQHRLQQVDLIDNSVKLTEKLLHIYQQKEINIDLIISSYNLLINLLPNLKQQLKLIVPQLFQLLNHQNQRLKLATLDVIGRIFAYTKIRNVSSLAVQSLVNIMRQQYQNCIHNNQNTSNSYQSNPIGMKAFETLQLFSCSLGKKFKIFIPLVNDVMIECQYYSYVFNAILSFYMNNVLIDQYLAVQFVTSYFSKNIISDMYQTNVLLSDIEVQILDNPDTEKIVNQFVMHQTPITIKPIPPSLIGYLQLDLQEEKLEVVSNIPKKIWVCDDIYEEFQWRQWLQNFNLQLIQHSPIPIIRDCYQLSQDSYPFARQLLNFAFFSYITDNNMVNELRSIASQTLRFIFRSETVPQDIQLVFLDLMEFLEHQQISINYLLDSDISLSKVSDRCCAFARSLRYREQEFLNQQISPDILMEVNYQLGYKDSISGIIIQQKQLMTSRCLKTVYNLLKKSEDYIKAQYQVYDQATYDEVFKACLQEQTVLYSQQNQSECTVNEVVEDISIESGIFSQIQELDIEYTFMQLIDNFKKAIDQIQIDEEFKTQLYLKTLDLLHTYFDYFAVNFDFKPNFYEYQKQYEVALSKYDNQIQILYKFIQEKDYSLIKEQIRKHQQLYIQKIQCYFKLGYHEQVLQETQNYKNVSLPIDIVLQKNYVSVFEKSVAIYCAQSAYELQYIQDLNYWLSLIGDNYKNILQILQLIKSQQYLEAQQLSKIYFRQQLTLVQSGLSESYGRAYPLFLQLQDLHQIQEVLDCLLSGKTKQHTNQLKQIWDIRIQNSQQTANTLLIRELILQPQCDENIYLTFADICIKEKKFYLARKYYQQLMKSAKLQSRIEFNLIKYDWENNRNIAQQLQSITLLLEKVDSDKILKSDICAKKAEWLILNEQQVQTNSSSNDVITIVQNMINQNLDTSKNQILDSCLSPQSSSQHSVVRLESLALLEKASILNQNNVKIQTEIGNLAYSYVNLHENEKDYLIKTALRAFFVCIRSNQFVVSSILKIIQIWSQNQTELCEIFLEEIQTIDIKIFIHAIPQLLSKKNNTIYSIIKDLAISQPLFMTFPLQVAARRIDVNYQAIANSILDQVRQEHPKVVSQMIEFQAALNKSAILWPEMTYDLINSSVLNYNLNKKQHVFYNIISQIHQIITQKAQSQSERLFQDQFLSLFLDAFTKLKQGLVGQQQQLIEVAKTQFIELAHQLNQSFTQTSIELEFASPYLFQIRNTLIPLPGQDSELLTVARMLPRMNVMRSKQRPRKIALVGSDGEIYAYLLKGREDLRLDERVMQLFKLNNALMMDDQQCSSRSLKILRYPVTPLGRTSGILFWVPKTETIHDMIKQQRTLHNVQETTEENNFKQRAGLYQNCSLLQKIEGYKSVMMVASSQDLKQGIWDSSVSAENWLVRRTAFSGTLAVMSGVGHILGLGDRHPQNIMISKTTGHVLHIDFGDCFEAAMRRQKLPEKVPFRLTKMMTNALEVCGIDGHFLSCFNCSMNIFRKENLAIMAVFETFKEDPLVREDDLTPNIFVERIKVKLEGKEFDANKQLSVEEQVQYLIKQATNIENLCQSYIGWCPFW